MKTKILLLFGVLFTCSILSISAQNLLISENFSTAEWEAEFVRLNPAYVTPAPNTTLAPATSPFITGFYNGYELFSGTIECGDGTLPCADGSMVHNNNGSGVAWRLKNKSSGVSYLTLPTISSAGTFILHVKTGGTNATNNHIELQQVDTIEGLPVVTVLKDWSLTGSGNAKFTTQLDEIKTYNVNSRGPITLRIGQAAAGAGVFVKIFGFEVEEHASVPLKHSIDSATTIQADNADNIGTTYGKYPQEAYDALGTAITNANVIFDNLESTSAQLIDGTTAINTAISDFEASIIDIGTGFNSTVSTTIKQQGRKLVSTEPTRISIYNIDGTLLYQRDQVKVMEVPTAIRQGIYLVKSNFGVQKMYFN